MASSSQAVLCRYHYDPLDRLAGTIASDLTNTQLFFQQNRLATEIHGAVQRTIVQHEDQLLAQQQRLGSSSETTLLATDQQRSVLHLVDNAEVHSLAYNPYGHHPAESGLTSLLGFNGEHRDLVTGHYLLGNGYRAFNPVLMRFNSPDSLSPFDEGGINAYAYCEGDPVNFGDETGHITGVLWRGLARVGIFKFLLKRPIPLIGTLRRPNYLLNYQKGSTASVNVVKAPPESSHTSSISRAPPPSTSRLEVVTSAGANSMSPGILSPKRRHDAWERLTNNLRRDSSSPGQPAVARFEAQRVRLHDIVYDSRILKKHYQTALLNNVNPEKYIQYIQKAVRYTRLEKKYTKRAQVFLRNAEAAARVRAST
nr:RHS repeat-associated core domain-containing protein [Pseudomonas syringae]